MNRFCVTLSFGIFGTALAFGCSESKTTESGTQPSINKPDTAKSDEEFLEGCYQMFPTLVPILKASPDDCEKNSATLMNWFSNHDVPRCYKTMAANPALEAKLDAEYAKSYAEYSQLFLNLYDTCGGGAHPKFDAVLDKIMSQVPKELLEE